METTVPTTPRKSMEPWIKDEVEYYPHQIAGIRTLAKVRSFILADDMGLGKSLQSLTLFAIDVVRGYATKAIVVAPVNLKWNWQDEIEKFTGFPCVVLDGTPKKREEQLLEFEATEGPKILIVNYEQVIAHHTRLDRYRFDIAMFDEAHYLKNPKAKRTKACLSMFSRRSFLLTGTPLLNHVHELWTLLHRVDPIRWPKYYSFVNRYAVFGGFKDKQIVGVKNEREIADELQKVMLRRLKSEVLNLPDVQVLERRVNMLPEQQKLYDEVVNEMKLTRLGEESPDAIENALTKSLRLLQICGSTSIFTGEDKSAKLDLALEDEMELIANGHRTVVFSQFRHVQAAYRERLQAVGIPTWEINGSVAKEDRSNIVKQWGMSQPGVLIAGTQVAGVGLNMTQSRHGAFLDKLYVPGLNQQAIDRLNRIGASETQPIQFRDYLTRNSVESRVNQILSIKKKVSADVVEADPQFRKKIYQAMMEEMS